MPLECPPSRMAVSQGGCTPGEQMPEGAVGGAHGAVGGARARLVGGGRGRGTRAEGEGRAGSLLLLTPTAGSL